MRLTSLFLFLEVISVAFSFPSWTWISGASSASEAGGTYGTKGVANSLNIPPGSYGGASWIDSNNNFWLFGGHGYDSTDTRGYLNHLWKFDGINWIWVSGSDLKNQTGIYGTKGIGSSLNIPGARRFQFSWKDSNNRIWIFGGEGYDRDEGVYEMSDLWRFDGTRWTWVSGPVFGGYGAVYGTKGSGNSSTIPGARCCGASSSKNNTFWLFGGYGLDSLAQAYGSDYAEQRGNYGTKGIASSSNVPGARSFSASWTDSDNNFWLFGGLGFDARGIQGSNLTNQTGTYGTKGIGNSSNIPGARQEMVSWTDSDYNFWLFGGAGNAATGNGFLNDLWKFDGTYWIWISGSYSSEQIGNYGTKGIASSSNIPGSRLDSIVCVGTNDLWLFGGVGYDDQGYLGILNDLWKWDLPSSLTTSPMTTSPLTTSPITSAEVTSSPLTTSLLSTAEVTSSQLTTSPITSGNIDENKNSSSGFKIATGFIAGVAAVAGLIVIGILITVIFVVHKKLSVQQKLSEMEMQNKSHPAFSSKERILDTELLPNNEILDRDTDYAFMPGNIKNQPDNAEDQKYIIDYSEIAIFGKLGGGFFGDVYKAEWRNVLVAVKRLKESAFSSNALKEFEAEAKLMQRIKPHPNVVFFYGVCKNPLCIVTEYVAKGALSSILESEEKIDKSIQLKIIIGIARGMFHLSCEQIVHKDLAARNILITENDEAKVGDFGMSRVLSSSSQQNRLYEKSEYGPLRWMAPESIGKSQYSAKTDVYSFGITIVEILTRKKPFSQFQNDEFVKELLSDRIRPAEELSPQNFSGQVRELVKSCTDMNPNYRPDFGRVVKILNSNFSL